MVISKMSTVQGSAMNTWEKRMKFIIILTLWIPLASSDPMQRSWCYTDPTNISISCNSSEFMLAIVKAFAGVSKVTDPSFCKNPIPQSGDCMLAENERTDYYRGICNGFSTCRPDLKHVPVNTCGYQGNMYLKLEYECHPISNSMRMEYPVLDPCSYPVEESRSYIIRLRSDGYPTTWQQSDECHCSVRLAYESMATISIRDMAHDDANNTACPFYVMINGMKICAFRGKVFTGVDVITTDEDKDRSYKDIPFTFYTENGRVKGRYWIDIETALPSGEHSTATVHCGKFGDVGTTKTQTPPTTPTPTPTTTIPTTTTTPTTTTPTTTTLEKTTNKTTLMTDSGPNRGQQVPDSMETSSLDTSQGNISTTTETGGTGAVPTSTTTSPQLMEETLDIKIIVGGAAAGGVLVILIIVFLSVCLNRSSSARKKKKGNDLGYSVHANVTVAENIRRSGRQSKNNQNTPGGSTVPPHYNGTLERNDVNYPRTRNQQRTLPGHSYVNVPAQSPKETHQGKSISQLTLHVSSNESLNNADLSNNIFAGFPRWTDNFGMDDLGHTYLNLPPGSSVTLPVKLNKRPMPLPKPIRHKSSHDLAKRHPVIVSNWRSASNSVISLGQADYGTGKSTEPLYSKKNKKSRGQGGITILENDMYGQS